MKTSLHLKAMLLVPACLVSGCATWSPETRIEEATYQAFHIADSASAVGHNYSIGLHFVNTGCK